MCRCESPVPLDAIRLFTPSGKTREDGVAE